MKTEIKLLAIFLVIGCIFSLSGTPAFAAEESLVSADKNYCLITLDNNGSFSRMYTDPRSPIMVISPDDPDDERFGMYTIQYNIFNPEFENRYAPGCPEAEGLYPNYVGESPASNALSGTWELPAVMNNCHAFSVSVEMKTFIGSPEDYDWYIYAFMEKEADSKPSIMFSQSTPFFSAPSTLTGTWSFAWGDPDASYPIKSFTVGPMVGDTVEYEQSVDLCSLCIATYDFDAVINYLTQLGLAHFLLDEDDDLVTSGRVIETLDVIFEEEGTSQMVSLSGVDYLLYTALECPIWILSPMEDHGEYFVLKYNTFFTATNTSLLASLKSDTNSAVVNYWQLPAEIKDCVLLYFEASCNVDVSVAKNFNWYIAACGTHGGWTAYDQGEFLHNCLAGYMWETEAPRAVNAFSVAPIRSNSATPASNIDYSLDVVPESLILITANLEAAQKYLVDVGLGEYLDF